MVRILLAGALLVAIAIAIVFLRSTPTPPTAPVGVPGSSAVPIAAPASPQELAPIQELKPQPTFTAPIAADVPSVTSSQPKPVPPPPASTITEQHTASVTTDPEPPIAGSSPYPAGGKPTGPFDLAWRLTRSGDIVTGSLTVTSLAPDSQVEVDVRPLGAITLRTQVRFAEVLARRVPRSFPIQASAPTGGSLVITVTQVLVGRLGRSITIDLPPPGQVSIPQSAVPSQSPTPGTTPIDGVRTIRDASGQVLHLAPARPGP